MRYLGVGLLALAWAAPALAGGQDLQEARKQLLHGHYGEARELFAGPAKKGNAAAVVGLSRAWRAEGEYDKAVGVLLAAVKEEPGRAEVWAELADLFYLRGRWDEAAEAARRTLELQPGGPPPFLAKWVLARLYRDRGDLKKAGEELVWFVRQYGSKDLTDPDELLLVGQAACERARWDSRLSDQFQFVLTEIYLPLAKKHKDDWRAPYLTGALYLEKYDKGRANKAFDRALAINARAAEVLAAKGDAALQRLDVKDAEHFAGQALQVNPRLVEGLCLRVDLALMGGDTADAMKGLEKARAVNPRAEATLGRVAACLYFQRKEAELADLARQVEKHNPKAGVFYHELAERLDQAKRYDDAEKYYRLSIKLRPKLVGARNSIGLLYMRLGREEEAREILDKAFEDDPFNVRIYNTLKVLDHLKKYETLKTPHFELRFDPKHDKVLAHFLAKYLEDIYAELAKEFQYRPEGPYLVEVFNRHTMFSGRVVALPDLHTIGACTGRMVALCSPHDKDEIVSKPFNWNRVLRHELTHVFNLDQTHFQVPHWLTEGLAVRSEQLPMPPVWNRILLDRVARGPLMNLDNILLGFVRPKSQDEWNQAYLQSYLYVEYIKKTYGEKAIGELLGAYRDNLDTAAALRKVCKVSKEEFEKGYRAYLEERAKNIRGRPAVKRLGFEALRAAHKKDRENAGVAAQLAEHYLLLGNREEARKLADAALERTKNQPTASYVKARLLAAGGETGPALKLLEAAVDRKAPDVKVVKLLGTLQFKGKNFREAAEAFELGRAAEPYDNFWLVQLARCYRQSGDTAKLIDTLKNLAPTDADDLDTRRELARRCLKAGRPAEAERYAREALEIDVLDREAQEALEGALKAQNKNDELRELRKLLGRS
jgi:tetratricopeptide (TPR) repeat protein